MQASFDRSVIKSAARLTYRQVENALVKKDPKTMRAIESLMPRLEQMGELAVLLKDRREKRGNLDFDLPEPDLILDMEGGIKDILRSERLFSQSIIEEFMIAANEAVAQFITEQKRPLIYRVHEPPEREKLADFERLIRTLGIDYSADRKGMLPLQAILKNVRQSEHEFLINRILLKSMKQARYRRSTRAISALPWTITATSLPPSAATRTSSATASSSTSSARGHPASRSTGKKSLKRWPATSPTGSAPRWKPSARRRTGSGCYS